MDKLRITWLYKAIENHVPPKEAGLMRLTRWQLEALGPQRATPLVYAARVGNREALRILLEQEPNVNAYDKNGQTALMHAAKRADTMSVHLLLQHNSNVNDVDTDGNSALHYAALAKAVDVARLLIKHGAAVDASNAFGVTPLMLACQNDAVECLKLLYDNGANVNHKGNFGHTAIFIAAEYNSVQCASYLINKGADLLVEDEKRYTALKYAKYHKQEQVAELLQQALLFCKMNPIYESNASMTASNESVTESQHASSHPDKRNNSPLDNTSKQNTNTYKGGQIIPNVHHFTHRQRLGAVFNDKKFPKVVNENALIELWQLCIQDQQAVEEFILESDVDINAPIDNKTLMPPLSYAIVTNAEPIIRLLLAERLKQRLNKGVKDNTGCTPLMHAVKKGLDCILLTQLATGDQQIDETNDVSNTALMIAAATGRKDIVRLLLDCGASPAAGLGEKTAVDVAAAANSAPIVALLLDHVPSDTDLQNLLDCALLHACRYVAPASVRVLLQRGASVEIHDRDECTPLDRAAAADSAPIVDLLLKHVPPGTHRQLLLNNALLYACRFSATRSARLLLQHGASVHVYGPDGFSPLEIARRANASGIVNLLLEKP